MSGVVHSPDGCVYRRPPLSSSWRLIAVSVLLLAGSALTATFLPQSWDFPVTQAINAYAHRSALLDRGMHALTTRDLLQGVPFLAMIWFLWFRGEEPARRGPLVIGILAASLAGALSRGMQLVLPTHLRPLHQPSLNFVLPFGVEPDTLNHFNSFPSDHGAVYFALAMVIWQARPSLGGAAFAWATIIDFARIYEGYHFLSDVIGSLGLGLALLCLLQNARLQWAVDGVLAFEQRRRPWFYMIAFIFSYLIATLFDDVRELCRGMAAVLLRHDLFNGP